MIFEEQIARKPNHYPWTKDFIDAMWAGHWTPNEFDFKSDVQDFKTELTQQEQEIIKRALSAIGQIEIAVKKFWSKLGDNLPHPSLTDLGLVMAQIEVIHNMAYEKLLDKLGFQEVFEENLKLKIIKNRVKYLQKYNTKVYTEDDKKQYIYSIILFTLFVENVSLFSQFYVILWFNRYKNVLKDTSQQVEYTRNEEDLHAKAGISIINSMRNEYPELFDQDLKDRIQEETLEAFDAESKIIDWIVGHYDKPKLNADILKEYIKKRINDSLKDIGFDTVFEVNNDMIKECKWMEEELSGNNMTDFFFKRPVEYSKKDKSFNEEDLF